MRSRCIAAAAGLLAAAAAGAAPVAVENASFETPAQSAMGDLAEGLPPGWSIDDPGAIANPLTDFGVWWPTGFFDYASGATDGNQVGFVYLDDPPGTGEAGLVQTLAAVLEPNTRYSFEVYVGDPTDYSAAELAGFPGYRVALTAGGALVVDDDDTAMQEGQLRPARARIPVGAVHARLGQPLAIHLINRNAAAGVEVDFDLVSVDATPAPIETYQFTVWHAGGSLAGLLVYDRDQSAATQVIGRDATVAITGASGDLAPFASIDFESGYVSASGPILTLAQGGSTGNLLLFDLGASVSLDAALPYPTISSLGSSVYLDSLAVVGPNEAGAVFRVPEAGAPSLGAFAAIAALVRRRSQAA